MTILLVFLVYAIALVIGLARGARRKPLAAQVASTTRQISQVLIVGATGGTGRQLVAQALERGYEVTAFVRNPSSLKIEHPKLRIMPGDVLDYASVETAMRGQDAVLSALGHKQFFYPTRILSDGTKNLLKAMETQGVTRFVCETSLGIGSSVGRLGIYYTFLIIPLVLPFYFWDKRRQEQIIESSTAEWVIVRPGLLTNAARRGLCRHSHAIGSFLWTVRISRADVADFMLKQLSEDTYLRKSVGACG